MLLSLLWFFKGVFFYQQIIIEGVVILKLPFYLTFLIVRIKISKQCAAIAK